LQRRVDGLAPATGRSRGARERLAHRVGRTVARSVDADRREGGDRVVEFTNRSAASTDRIRHDLDGGTSDE